MIFILKGDHGTKEFSPPTSKQRERCMMLWTAIPGTGWIFDLLTTPVSFREWLLLGSMSGYFVTLEC